MNRLKYQIYKYKFIIITILLLIIVIFILYIHNLNKNTELKIEPLVLEDDNVEINEEIVSKIKVDIKGYVKKTGVYELDSGSRVIDVINMAGGLKEGANTEYINLSKKLTDEMIIIVYSNEEVKEFKETEKEVIYIEYECVCPDNINDSCINQNDVVNTNGVKDKNENIEDNLISINTASKDELMTLSGIGESKAIAIIEYRESNGLFEKLEDIMNVSGIGESAYSKIKDYIKL